MARARRRPGPRDRRGVPVGREAFVIVDGEAVVKRNGRRVASLGPGDYFGELAVIDPAPRDASVVATTPVELMVIGRRRFWTTVEASPSLMRKLMIGLARRLHEADRREIDLRKANSLTGS